MLFLMLSGKNCLTFRGEKIHHKCFFPSCVLISLSNYFASEKEKGNCCDQLPLTIALTKA